MTKTVADIDVAISQRKFTFRLQCLAAAKEWLKKADLAKDPRLKQCCLDRAAAWKELAKNYPH